MSYKEQMTIQSLELLEDLLDENNPHVKNLLGLALQEMIKELSRL